jgi:RND family efflux transporter MFP subunit
MRIDVTRMSRLMAAWAMALLLTACRDDAAEHAKAPALPKLETIVIAANNGNAVRRWDGVVEAVRDATLSAQTSARVAEVAADVNDRVAAGQVLLRLTVVEQQAGVDAARAQLRAAEASATEAERQYQRFVSLAKDKFVSRAQLDQAQAARDAAIAARDAARAQVAAAGQGAAYTVIRAPYAGVVAMRSIEPGETVAPGQALMTMYAPEDVRIELQLPQSAADAVRAAPGAQVRFDDGRSVDAREVVVYPSADPISHSVAVRVLLPRMAAPVAPGTSASVAFAVGQNDAGSARGLQLPQSAILRRGELTAAYVLKDGRLFLRQLRLGERDGDRVEILSGLKPGDAVVRDPLAATTALAAQRRSSDAHE